MPIFFEAIVDENTRLGIWKIEETEDFFKGNVPQHRDVTHPRKRLQHLAGRFLLQFLFPDFPYELVKIADTRKPFLPDEQYHFSISHCGDYAAAIVSKNKRVGIDVEIPNEKILRIADKFISEKEYSIFQERLPTPDSRLTTPDSRLLTHDSGLPTHDSRLPTHDSRLLTPDSGLPTPDSRLPTLLWSAKEAMYKWYGDGGVDFRQHIHLLKQHEGSEIIDCLFEKTNQHLSVHYRQFEHLMLAWVVS